MTCESPQASGAASSPAEAHAGAAGGSREAADTARRTWLLRGGHLYSPLMETMWEPGTPLRAQHKRMWFGLALGVAAFPLFAVADDLESIAERFPGQYDYESAGLDGARKGYGLASASD